MPSLSENVSLEVRNHLGVITLDRPEALNAVTHAMVVTIGDLLDECERSARIRTVALRGAGARGLCAGGDIREIRKLIISGRLSAVADFWRDEYRLDARIAAFPKPVVTMMSGIVLGGGVGLSAHASHRIVTDDSTVGMPETRIGFVPDVGGTWLLSRAPGELGTYLALTARSVGPGDAIALGLADDHVEAAALDDLWDALTREGADEALARHRSRGGLPTPLHDQRPWIDSAFSADSVDEILDRVAAVGTPASEEANAAIRANSPHALHLALESLRRARQLSSLAEALQQEFRVSKRLLHSPDFAEGIRARVIDKDQPIWSDDESVCAAGAYFERLPEGEELVITAAGYRARRTGVALENGRQLTGIRNPTQSEPGTRRSAP